MHIEQFGHAVLKVRDMARAESFYCGVLGMPVATRVDGGMQMTFFTLGNHHDFALLAVGSDAPDARDDSPGLFHVAFKVGDSLDQLRAVKKELEAAGVAIDMVVDHTVTQSIYLHDPDGNGVELYVDGSDAWRTEPQLVADFELMEL
jgi:catechol 2,3-dioxygenase